MKNEKWDDVHGNTTPDDRMVAFLESKPLISWMGKRFLPVRLCMRSLTGCWLRKNKPMQNIVR